jgi:hypothetical protein
MYNRYEQNTDYNTMIEGFKTKTNKPDFVIYGMYNGDVLNGFAFGYGINESTFSIAGIYIDKFTRDLKSICSKLQEYAVERGYKYIKATCNTKEAFSLATKFAPLSISIDIVKDLSHG